jgi:glycerol-3-phosphate dehydrogenase
LTTREGLVDRLRAGEKWDVVVIGGGATGLGTAVDAASRGYSTLLLEADDFARGTSSRSTKLVHGGVRYLAQGNLKLVREALHERGVLLRNAPHLAHRREFLVPAYSWAGIGYYGLGLKAYDLLAGPTGLGGSHPVGRAEALRLAPTLEPGRLRGGVVYADGQFDDARFAIALVRTLFDLGGVALNRMSVARIAKERGKAAGVEAVDGETDESLPISAWAVVNATGVEADAVRAMDQPGTARSMRPSRGSHVVLDRSFLPGEAAVMIPKTDDGRVLFAIPWLGRVLLGTTDMPVDRATREPRPSPEEIGYLLDHAGRYFTRKPGVSDVLSTFAGLRPLLGKGGAGRTSSLSREHAVFVSDSGLVTIAGGKWTTYRRMGSDAVDRAVEVAGLEPRPCWTEALKLHGWSAEVLAGPFASHGSDAPELERLAAEHPGWGEPIHPRLPDRRVEVIWAARHELARSVEDILARRTRGLFLDAKASIEAAPAVASLLASELGRDPAWERSEVEAFRKLAEDYLPKIQGGRGGWDKA